MKKLNLFLFIIFVFPVFAQPVSENRILLDANKVFFTSKGKLLNVVDKGKKGEAINQNKYFIYTKGWKTVLDTLVWGIDVFGKGEIFVSPLLGVPSCQAGSKIRVMLDSQFHDLVLESTGGYEDFEKQGKISFHVPQSGRYVLKMCMVTVKSPSEELAYVKGLDCSCTTGMSMAPLKLRWRPMAVHCGFSNSTNPDSIVIAIHENIIQTTGVDCYQPITTPFGYYGSTWDSDNFCFGGINFSLWSFSAKEEIPPAYQFSHLIAVGKGLYIDGFNHEGTGVKARGRNPYKGLYTNRQVLAIKKIPGIPYDTYYSYYWDDQKQEWMLYGCGKKYNDKEISYLRTGAFVEQPGPAEKERSNHIMREVHFRGWLIDRKGEIFSIDQMYPQGSINVNSYKGWGKTADGYFYMQMGGFNKERGVKPSKIMIDINHDEYPVYLAPEKLKGLENLPVTITQLPEKDITKRTATLEFVLERLLPDSKIILYWGKNDALTFVKSNKGNANMVYWENKEEKYTLTGNNVEYKLQNLSPGTTYYYRLQVINENGETWSFNTGKFQTTN